MEKEKPIKKEQTTPIKASASNGKKKSIATINTAKLLNDSAPAKAALKHIEEVAAVLQQGYNDLELHHKERINMPQTQQLLQDNLAGLQRHLEIEKQDALAVVNALLVETVKEFRDEEGYELIIGEHLLLAWDNALDITDTLMGIFNKKKPKFADLPKVSIKK